MNQETVFLGGEGDAWYDRNQISFIEAAKHDWPLVLFQRNNLKPKSILELGCSNGWRLAKLKDCADYLVGVDASQKAIRDGKKLYSGLELHHGSITAVPVSSVFDLVIVNFVLHWVDRILLAKAVSEIDRLLANHGMLIIGDFWPENPTRRHYHHLPEDDVWTWKNDYPQVFQSFGTYQKVDSQVFFHNSSGTKIPLETSSGRASCVLLQKDLSGGYEIEI